MTGALSDSPYLRRVVADEALHEKVRDAYDSGRSAYARLSKRSQPAEALLEDRRLRREVAQTLRSLREATELLRAAPKRARPRRRAALVVAGACVAVALVRGRSSRTGEDPAAAGR